MSILNLPQPDLSPEGIGRFLGLMLLAMQPFPGGARIPALLLFLLGLWMLWTKRISIRDRSSKRLGVAFLLLGIPVVLSIPGSYAQSKSINIALLLPLFYVIGLALIKSLATPLGRSRLQHWILILMLIWLTDAYIQFFLGKDVLGIPIYEDRIVGPFDGNIFLSIYLPLMLPVALWNLSKQRPLLAIALIGLVGFISAMSGSRFTLLMFLLSCITLIPRFSLKHISAFAIITTIAISSAVYLSENLNSRLTRFTMINSEPGMSLTEKLDFISSWRITLWTTGLRMIQAHPMAGVGTNAFKEAYIHHAPPDDYLVRTGYGIFHAHHLYISIAAETGLIGLGCFIAILVLSFRHYFSASKMHRQYAILYANPLIVVIFPFPAQPVLFTFWWFPVIMLFYCGMLAALESTTPENVPTPSGE
jgi:O-antigen ligase